MRRFQRDPGLFLASNWADLRIIHLFLLALAIFVVSAFSRSHSRLVRQLLNLARFAHDGHGERILVRFVDLSFQSGRQLQQISSFVSNLLLLWIACRYGGRAGRAILRRCRIGRMGRRGGCLLGRFCILRRRRLRVPAEQPGARGDSCDETARQRAQPDCPSPSPESGSGYVHAPRAVHRRLHRPGIHRCRRYIGVSGAATGPAHSLD